MTKSRQTAGSHGGAGEVAADLQKSRWSSASCGEQNKVAVEPRRSRRTVPSRGGASKVAADPATSRQRFRPCGRARRSTARSIEVAVDGCESRWRKGSAATSPSPPQLSATSRQTMGCCGGERSVAVDNIPSRWTPRCCGSGKRYEPPPSRPSRPCCPCQHSAAPGTAFAHMYLLRWLTAREPAGQASAVRGGRRRTGEKEVVCSLPNHSLAQSSLHWR